MSKSSEVVTRMVDPQNQIQEFERGGLKGTFQAWRHGCTIFGIHRLGEIDDLFAVLKHFKESYGNVRVVNVSHDKTERALWFGMMKKGLVDSLGDHRNQEIELPAEPAQELRVA